MLDLSRLFNVNLAQLLTNTVKSNNLQPLGLDRIITSLKEKQRDKRILFCNGSQRIAGRSREKMDGTLKFMRKCRVSSMNNKAIIMQDQVFSPHHYRKTQNHYHDLPCVFPLLLGAGTGLLNVLCYPGEGSQW